MTSHFLENKYLLRIWSSFEAKYLSRVRHCRDIMLILSNFYRFPIENLWYWRMLGTKYIGDRFNTPEVSPTWELCHQHQHQVEINPGISISIKKIVGEMGKLLDQKKCMWLTGNHEQYTFFIVQHFVGHNLDDLSLRTFWFLTRRPFDLFQFAS